MGKHLVLIGGGHAHMTVMQNVDDFVRRGHRVTLINPNHYQYYSGMGPGLLGGHYRPGDARFHVSKMVSDRGGTWLAKSVVRVVPESRQLILNDGHVVSYDVASFNVGSQVVMGEGFAPGPKLVPVKPVLNLALAHRDLLARPTAETVELAVVGGGPAGVEVAGNLQRLLEQTKRQGQVTLVAGSKLLQGLPDKVGALVRENFARRGVSVVEGSWAGDFSGNVLTLDDGQRLSADLVFLATGVRPPDLFIKSGLTQGDDGGLPVNAFLQCTAYPELFGGGDCITFASRPLAKVGVYAVRQNPILQHNLLAALEDGPLKRFDPQAHYLLILNLGDGHGVLRRKSWVGDGRWSFRFKDWIDRRFMQRFQLSGERSDPETALEGEPLP